MTATIEKSSRKKMKILKNIMKEATFKKKIKVNNLAKVRKEIKDFKVITR
jgi:hypothetical protein